MSNRYDSMRAFQDDLDHLCELCGLEVVSAAVPKASKAVEITERVFRDDSLMQFLHEMCIRIRKAIKEMENRKIERWSMLETEKYMSELEEHNQKLLAGLKEQNRKFDEELESCRTKETQARSRAAMLEIELQELKKELAEYSEKLNEQKRELTNWIQGMIAMCDRMQARLEWAEDTESGNDDVIKLLRLQLREAEELMQKAGVEILAGSDVAFNPSRHIVKGVRSTMEADRDGTVACTCRPGYVFRGEELRGQEVIVYQAERD